MMVRLLPLLGLLLGEVCLERVVIDLVSVPRGRLDLLLIHLIVLLVAACTGSEIFEQLDAKLGI